MRRILEFLIALRSNIRAGLKRLAHRHPLLLQAVRGVRSFFCKQAKAPKLVSKFDPLHPDAQMLTEFAAISPELLDAMMAEFSEMAKVLRRLDTGADDAQRWLAEYPIERLLAAGADLNMVYSPPKVGGTTMAATVQRHPAMKGAVRHLHFLSSKGIAYVEQVMERFPLTAGNWRDNLFRARWSRILLSINRSLRAKNRSAGAAARKPCVVAGVRDPIALHLSFCFEGWWLYGDTPDILTPNFVRARLADDAWHLTCNDWFDNELKEIFGLDIFAHPFPTDRGWEIYENHEVRALVIRMESLAALPDALGTLYRVEPTAFTVAPSNRAEDKAYALQYGAVKKSLSFSELELDTIYSLPYVQHFYTQAEIEAFKKRWSGARAALEGGGANPRFE